MKAMTVSLVAGHSKPVRRGLMAAVLQRCGFSPSRKLSLRATCAACCAVLGLLGAVPALTAQEVASEANDVPGMQGTVSGPDMSDHVSPGLDPDEFALVRTYMNALPLQVRERINGMPPGSFRIAIVEGGTGIIHYNWPEDAGSFEVRSGPPLPGDEHPFAGDESENPEGVLGANPGLFGGSGPYRRVYTTPVLAEPYPKGVGATSGDYSAGGVATTGCNAGSFATGDTGYAYLGGWSGDWNTLPKRLAGHAVVDAGLQYNLGTSSKHDDYAMFMKIGRDKIISVGNDPLYSQPPHIMCGGITGQEFRVVAPVPQLQSVQPACWIGTGRSAETLASGPNPACDTYALMLFGESRHFVGHLGSDMVWAIEWVAPSWDDGGWAQLVKFNGYWEGKQNVTRYTSGAPCSGCIFKWMTSIAQSTEDLDDGSTYSATWTYRKISGYAFKGGYPSGLVSLQPQITDCSEYPLWIPPYGKPYNADCKNTPTGLKGVAQSNTVQNYSATGETDTINLKY